MPFFPHLMSPRIFNLILIEVLSDKWWKLIHNFYLSTSVGGENNLDGDDESMDEDDMWDLLESGQNSCIMTTYFAYIMKSYFDIQLKLVPTVVYFVRGSWILLRLIFCAYVGRWHNYDLYILFILRL